MFYWILEYGKLLIAYLLIMYFWPSVVLRDYLSKKSLSFRFSFCTTFMILLLNTAVLMLGIFNLLSQWIVRLLFYGPLFCAFIFWLYRNRSKAIHIKYLLTGICSFKHFVVEIKDHSVFASKRFCKKLLNKIRPHLLLYIILAVVMVYGMTYFSYGAFHERFYGASDVYVHHSWIDMLSQGEIFGAGIYPEGMHCFVYALNTLFGLEYYSCLLFLGGIHISAFLLSVYLFFKEIFTWKYSSAFVLVLYLILRVNSQANEVGMARLQWGVPQEFALFTVFLCAAYLLRFLRSISTRKLRWKKWEFLLDENLLIFLMALAVSIAVHFYATIMAFFLCLAIGLFFIVSAFTRKKVLPLLLAILFSVVISVTPMLSALAIGFDFQGSIGWAIGVISDTSQDAEDAGDDSLEPTENISSENTEPELNAEDAVGDSQKAADNISFESIESDPDTSEVKQNETKVRRKVELKKLYASSFNRLYKEGKAPLMLGFVLLGVLLGIICHITSVIKQKTPVADDPFCGYLFLCMAVLIFMMLYAAPLIGLPQIVQIDRLGTMTHILTIATVFIPLDLIMAILNSRKNRLFMDICATLLIAGMCVCVFILGEYHGYLHYIITRYPAAAEVTHKIIHSMEPDSFTIVSPVDELYQVKNYGYHEEWTQFVNEIAKDNYTLPTEYVFIYIEKQPLQYAHNRFLDGPSWLAHEKYLAIVGESVGSQSPNVLHSEISEEIANSDIVISNDYDSYVDLTQRTFINSKIYQWAERFKEYYPHHLTTVYEDEAFVCYMIRQNPKRLLNLAIMN